jgi:NAD-dependent SIR2 family protein deacetylase
LTDSTPDRNVFILGAGFSADAGAPLINNFLDAARELYDDPDSGLDDLEKAEFEAVFQFKKHVAQAREKFRIDLDNIEQLFGLIEMSHRLGSEGSAVRDAMVYVIAKTLQLAIERKRNKPHIRISPNPPSVPSPWTGSFNVAQQVEPNVVQADIYRYFAMLLSGKFDEPTKLRSRTNVVITFNYDIVLDNALRQISLVPDYGLADVQDQHVEGEARISLLKLHGSTNWAICPSCKSVIILDDAKFTNDPNAFRLRPCSKCTKTGLRLLIVPPSWDKSEYRDKMRPVWTKATEALKRAKRICIIGYSMPETDTFFRFLLTLGLADNHQLFKFVVVDLIISSGSSAVEKTIEQRYRDILEEPFASRRFEFFGDGFANFLTVGSSAIGRAERVVTRGLVF